MAKVVPLQDRFSGMVQDSARYSLPSGKCWNMVDYISDLQASARKRGGWTRVSNDIAAASTSASYVSMLGFAPFAAGARLCYMTDNSKFGYMTPGSLTVAEVSTSGVQSACPWAFHSEKLLIPANDGTTAPKYYDRTTFGNLAGSPPAGKFVTVWKDRSILGGTAAQPTRTYFSALADPTSWDTTNSWISDLAPITGYAALPGALMIFQAAAASRVRGSTPPTASGTGGGDFIHDDPVFNVGCTDARSIAVTGAIACFCNPNGVYLTNGTNIPVDITERAGLKKLWQDTLGSYDASSWTLAGGIFRNTYYVAVMHGSTFADALWFDLNDYSGGRMANLKASAFDAGVGSVEELYFASRSEARVNALSTIYLPHAQVKNDGDGTPVEPIVETPFYLDTKSGKKTWRYVYLEYDLRDSSTDLPVLTISYIQNPDDSYTPLPDTLPATSTMDRQRLQLDFAAEGIGFKIEQSNASADTRLVAISADVHTREPSRLG